MKQNILKQISTLNYIDSWAKQVKRQTEDIKKLFSNTFGNHHRRNRTAEVKYMIIFESFYKVCPNPAHLSCIFAALIENNTKENQYE